MLLKFTAAVATLLHKDWLVIVFTVAVGLTVMLNVMSVPTQLTPALVNVGVTVIVATAGALVLFIAVKDGMFPAPLAARPILVLLFAQLNTTLLPPLPLLGLVKMIVVVDEALHNTWFATAFTVAVGFTVMVNVNGIPTQLTPLLVNVGVTVIVATTGVVVLLVATKVGILPEPLAAIPIDGSLFTQS